MTTRPKSHRPDLSVPLGACLQGGAYGYGLKWIFLDEILVALGASDITYTYKKKYVSIVIGFGIFSMISN